MFEIMVQIKFTILRSAQIHRQICCPCVFKETSHIVINFLMHLFLSDALFYTHKSSDLKTSRLTCTNWELNKYEPRHEISNKVVCAISKGSDQPAQSLC